MSFLLQHLPACQLFLLQLGCYFGKICIHFFTELETSACIFVQKPLSGFVKFRELPVTPANVGPELYLWHWWPSHYAQRVEILGGCIRLCFGEVLLMSVWTSIFCDCYQVKTTFHSSCLRCATGFSFGAWAPLTFLVTSMPMTSC